MQYSASEVPVLQISLSSNSLNEAELCRAAHQSQQAKSGGGFEEPTCSEGFSPAGQVGRCPGDELSFTGETKAEIELRGCVPANPRLIDADITGYGDLRPEADKPGFDVTAYWQRGTGP